ncbi:MAG: TIGR04255 family protein [Deltaproteobacteria bacterium]|jgi:hypothetical protein|nr:TIGR04255 family protein [Deltaproteobacteria bacterium]
MTDKIESSFSTGTLPSYKNPPVNEVVCGLRFDTPDKLRIPHIGFLWDKFRADYPIIQHAPPIASAKGEILVDQATGMPLPRVWFINRSDDQLIQFQCDRFYFLHDPLIDDLSHSGICNLKQNEELIAELILETVREFYSARN